MIDFRYHLVSLVSVFLALAVGIVLGAGPLKGTIGDTLSSEVAKLRQEKADLRTELDTAQAAGENRDTFVTSVSPSLVRQQLTGTRVVLITLPGSDSDAVKPLTAVVRNAGATVTGQIDLKAAWTDPNKAADRQEALRSLGTVAQAAPTPSAAGSPSGSPASASAASPAPVTVTVAGADTTSTGLAALLARAVVTDQATETGAPDQTARTLVDGLHKAGLLNVNGDLTARATTAIVLAPAVEPVAADQPSATPTSPDPTVAWAALAAALDSASAGTVVAGPASSASAGGLVLTVRGQQSLTRTISTVDSGGTPMGDVATVLALREQTQGGAGSYGFVGKGTSPLPSKLLEVTP